jgi:L-threonylcarbamoyladenylate synthase
VTRRLVPRSAEPDDPAIREAAACLQAGGLVVFPTETVYGLGADATNARAIAAVYDAKGRPADNPLIVHVRDLDDAAQVADVRSQSARRFAERFWPGPLSLVLPATALGSVASRGRPTVAVRAPSHPIARALLVAAGLPLAAPSANRSGRPSPTTAEHALAELDGRVALVLDGGSCRFGIESSVLDLTVDPPRLLRPGGVSLAVLRQFDPHVSPGGDAARSPGTRYAHYQPIVPLIALGPAVSAEVAERLVLVLDGPVAWMGPRAIGPATFVERVTADAVAHHLYADLRDLEQDHATLIVRLPDAEHAVAERARRAASWTFDSDDEVTAWIRARTPRSSALEP